MQLATSIVNVNPLRTLSSRLCRELVQSERWVVVHAPREARRLGDTPPARALRAIGVHAQTMLPRLEELVDPDVIPVGLSAGRRIGELFSALRHLFDRWLDLERSYRHTLLGFHEGLAVTRLLRDVSERLGAADLLGFCDEWLAQREQQIETAERDLHWFAEMPRHAIRSGMRIVAFEAAHE
jgi:hypothetical protein